MIGPTCAKKVVLPRFAGLSVGESIKKLWINHKFSELSWINIGKFLDKKQ